MAAEWKEIWALVSDMIARQPPPVQIFVWLGVAFLVLMVVEGLRASFLPRRLWESERPRGPTGARGLVPSPPVAVISDIAFVRALRSSAVKYRKLVDAAPRPFQAFRPKIRRTSSAFEPMRNDGRLDDQTVGRVTDS